MNITTRFQMYVLIALTFILFAAGSAAAEWRVAFESKTVYAGQTEVEIKLNLTTDAIMGAMTIPVVVREKNPDAFWTGTLPYDTGGMWPRRHGVEWTWADIWAVLVNEVLPGVPSSPCITDGDLV